MHSTEMLVFLYNMVPHSLLRKMASNANLPVKYTLLANYQNKTGSVLCRLCFVKPCSALFSDLKPHVFLSQHHLSMFASTSPNGKIDGFLFSSQCILLLRLIAAKLWFNQSLSAAELLQSHLISWWIKYEIRERQEQSLLSLRLQHPT